MALQTGHELFGPGDMGISSAGAAGPGGLEGTGAHAPEWGVGNPVSVAMAGLQQEVQRFGDIWDSTQVSDFLLRKQGELNEKYFHPETGLFNTRKGGDAQGIYAELVEDAKRIADEDAVRELSSRQRGMANSSLATMFTDMGGRVASFENQELMGYHVNKINDNIFKATELIAKSGNLDVQALGQAYSHIQSNIIDMGKAKGWDEETIVRETKTYFGQAVVKGALAASVTDAVKAYGALQSYQDVIPADAFQEATKKVVGVWNEQTLQKFYDIYQTEGPEKAREFLKSVSAEDRSASRAVATASGRQNDSVTVRTTVPGRSQGRSASAESGGKSDAVNWKDTSGVSCGLYQIHRGPKSDTMRDFENFLRRNGKNDVADQLKGLKGDALGNAWQRLVRSGKITDSEQTDFINESLVQPGIAQLPEALRDRIRENSTYLDMAWSTIVQHGPGGNARGMKAAWEASGGNDAVFIEKLFEWRKTQFNDQPENMRQSIIARMDKEKQRALGELNENPVHDPATGGMRYQPYRIGFMKPTDVKRALAELNKLETAKSRESRRIMNEQFPQAAATYMIDEQAGREAFDIIQESLANTGDAKAMRSFTIQRDKYEKLIPYKRSISHLPFAQQEKLLEDWFKEETHTGVDGNAAEMGKMQKEAMRILSHEQSEAQKDKAGYIAKQQVQEAQRDRANPTIPPQGKDERDIVPKTEDVQAGKAPNFIQENIRRQQEMFGTFQALPTEKLHEYKTMMENLNIPVQEKMDALLGIREAYGEYAVDAFSELKLDGGIIAAVNHVAANGNRELSTVRLEAEKLMTAAMTPWTAIHGQAEDDAMAKRDYVDKAKELGMVVQNRYATIAMGNTEANVIRHNQYQEAVAKAIALGFMKDMDNLSGNYVMAYEQNSRNINESGAFNPRAKAVITIPASANVNPDDVVYGLGQFVKEELTGMLPELPAELAKQPAYAQAQDFRIASILQDTTGISVDGGDNVMLFYQGQRLLDRKGNKIVLSAADLATKYRKREDAHQGQMRGNAPQYDSWSGELRMPDIRSTERRTQEEQLEYERGIRQSYGAHGTHTPMRIFR